MEHGNIRVQFVTECPSARLTLSSGTFSDKQDLLTQLKDLTESPRQTEQLLSSMITKLQPEDSTSRRKVGVYLTDGKSGDLSSVQRVAMEAKGQGVEMFGFGVDDGVDEAELEAIASGQHPFHLFMYKHHEVGRLTDAARKIARQLCSHVYGTL
jgi:hypothetical protein